MARVRVFHLDVNTNPASSVADIELFCRATFGIQDSLHSVTPVPYRSVELPSKLRFGYYLSGGLSSDM